MTTFVMASTLPPWYRRLPEILSRYFQSLDAFGWALLLVALLVYVLMTIRVAKQMRRVGHNAYLWFVISLLLTAMPASFVLMWHNFGWLLKKGGHPPDTRFQGRDQDEQEEEQLVRCPQCARRVSLAEAGMRDAVRTCPRCGQPWDQDVSA